MAASGAGRVLGVKPFDGLDDLDRRIIVALQRDGRASWTAIAEMCNSSVPTVTRRGQQLLADGVVRVAVVPQLGSTGPVESFFIRINCQPGMQLAVANELVSHENVRFLSLVTGTYDLMAELVVSGGAASFPHLIQELQSITGIERWRSDLILHVYKVGHDWGEQLLRATLGDRPGEATGGQDLAFSEPQDCTPEHFDESDLAILTALREDGRVTFKHVAGILDMNESSVRRRFERMRASGCIDIVALVPAAALGLGAETLLTVQVAPSRLESVARQLALSPEVRYLAATLDENSLMCEVIAKSTADLFHFITSTIASLDGVQGWSAAMELLWPKRAFVESPWWRAQVAEGLSAPSSVLPLSRPSQI
jgi:DNA-binding Lrp family transcriptional regulator